MKSAPNQIRKAREKLQRAEHHRDRLLQRLHPEEHDYLLHTLQEWRRIGEFPPHGPSRAHIILAAEDYERVPVSVRQFIYDDRYLGTVLKTNVFPKLVDDLEEFFEGDYTEAVVAYRKVLEAVLRQSARVCSRAPRAPASRPRRKYRPRGVSSTGGTWPWTRMPPRYS